MKWKDRYFIFRISNGELILTTNHLNDIYKSIYYLSKDLTNDYIVYDNYLNEYIDLLEVFYDL